MRRVNTYLLFGSSIGFDLARGLAVQLVRVMSNLRRAIDGGHCWFRTLDGCWWQSLWLVLEFELLFNVSIELSGDGLDCQVRQVQTVARGECNRLPNEDAVDKAMSDGPFVCVLCSLELAEMFGMDVAENSMEGIENNVDASQIVDGVALTESGVGVVRWRPSSQHCLGPPVEPRPRSDASMTSSIQ